MRPLLTVALLACAHSNAQRSVIVSEGGRIPRAAVSGVITEPLTTVSAGSAGDSVPASANAVPAARLDRIGFGSRPPQEGVDWTGLFRASGRFLAIEHGFRLLTEPGTRSGLSGSFFGNYGRAVGNLHGWADGDEFYVNYIGHPMQGSVAGFLWVQNDRGYRQAQFGKNRVYWRSRLRAAAFTWAYSEQFEIGLVSEASIGGIQASFPQQGFVDHVITPSIGLAWMIAEDAVDRYLIKRIEGQTENRFVRLLARSTLNPCRTLANVLQNRAPWTRDTRAGVVAYTPIAGGGSTSMPARTPDVFDVAGPAPFEFGISIERERFLAPGRIVCVGGEGSAAFRLSPAWQLVVDIGGCKLFGLPENLSGDSLSYLVGPRFRTRDRGHWSANLQILIGGNKLTQEHMHPDTKRRMNMTASQNPSPQPASHSAYVDETTTNGFAVRGGVGVNYKLNAALSIRVAELAFQHAWTSQLSGRSYSDTVRLSSGLTVRIGTW